MNRIKYDSDSIKLITLFESMTGAKVKDLIAGEKLIFIIKEGEMGKAIGKNGVNIKRMEDKLKKKIRLIEFSNDVLQFIKNVIHPLEASDIKNDGGIINIYGKDVHTKSMMVGREHQNINNLKDIVKRYFEINEIKVL